MSEIEAKVRDIIVEKLGVDEADVKPEASFTNDLGADSRHRRAYHGFREEIQCYHS